jgi:hypothetical protein
MDSVRNGSFRAAVEYKLNCLGKIPVISMISGTARYICGIAQTAFSSLGVAFNLSAYAITGKEESRKKTADAFWDFTHGYANMFRGGIEALSGSLTAATLATALASDELTTNKQLRVLAVAAFVSNLILPCYDHFFGFRMNYPSEYVPRNKLPLYGYDPHSAS